MSFKGVLIRPSNYALFLFIFADHYPNNENFERPYNHNGLIYYCTPVTVKTVQPMAVPRKTVFCKVHTPRRLRGKYKPICKDQIHILSKYTGCIQWFYLQSVSKNDFVSWCFIKEITSRHVISRKYIGQNLRKRNNVI